MKIINYIYILTLSIFIGTSCSTDDYASFDEERGLQTEFPDALFEVSFDFFAIYNGETAENMESILAPTPKDPYSFTSFKAESDVKNDMGIRYVESTLFQGLHSTQESQLAGDPKWEDNSTFIIKLNVATSGDALNGEPYEKQVLLDFLEEGKVYPTEKDMLGAIELMYTKDDVFSKVNEGKRLYVGIDEYNNIGESQYGVRILSIEDHEDRTREGELIKTALKVTIAFEGILGVSSNPNLSEELKVDQWNIERGTASFIIDYAQ